MIRCETGPAPGLCVIVTTSDCKIQGRPSTVLVRDLLISHGRDRHDT
jgi:hypothetical protein